MSRSCYYLALIALLALTPAPVFSQSSAREHSPTISSSNEDTLGMISLPSKHNVQITSERLERLIREKGLSFFGKIDHRANAERAKLSLRPTMLILFGNPHSGTLLMHQNQTIGLDLPLKYLVWQTSDKEVYITWNNPYYLARRHGLPPDLELLAKTSQLLTALAQQAGN
ncbi:MAG: DUF302 domain-containing protein [Candidatus Sericytochromatia bacterium]